MIGILCESQGSGREILFTFCAAIDLNWSLFCASVTVANDMFSRLAVWAVGNNFSFTPFDGTIIFRVRIKLLL